jgi:hypothetical protein
MIALQPGALPGQAGHLHLNPHFRTAVQALSGPGGIVRVQNSSCQLKAFDTAGMGRYDLEMEVGGCGPRVFGDMRNAAGDGRMRTNKGTSGLIGMVLVFLLSGFSFSDDAVAESQWTTSPPKVDGLAGEWPSDRLYSEKGVNVDYAFRNDGRNLYILFMLRNSKSPGAIDAGEMTIYLGTAGKKKKDFGVRFIKRTVTTDQFIAAMEKLVGPLTEENKMRLLTEPYYTVLEADAVDKKGKVIPPSGPRAEVELPAFNGTRQGGLTTYEFSVPLSSGKLYPGGFVAEPGTNIEVGFEWGGLAKVMGPAMPNRPEPPPPSGAPTGSGEPTEFGETPAQKQLSAYDVMSGPDRSGIKKRSFWVRVKLAQDR